MAYEAYSELIREADHRFRFRSSALAKEWQRLENRISVTELRLERAKQQRGIRSSSELLGIGTGTERALLEETSLPRDSLLDRLATRKYWSEIEDGASSSLKQLIIKDSAERIALHRQAKEHNDVQANKLKEDMDWIKSRLAQITLSHMRQEVEAVIQPNFVAQIPQRLLATSLVNNIVPSPQQFTTTQAAQVHQQHNLQHQPPLAHQNQPPPPDQQSQPPPPQKPSAASTLQQLKEEAAASLSPKSPTHQQAPIPQTDNRTQAGTPQNTEGQQQKTEQQENKTLKPTGKKKTYKMSLSDLADDDESLDENERSQTSSAAVHHGQESIPEEQQQSIKKKKKAGGIRFDLAPQPEPKDETTAPKPEPPAPTGGGYAAFMSMMGGGGKGAVGGSSEKRGGGLGDVTDSSETDSVEERLRAAATGAGTGSSKKDAMAGGSVADNRALSSSSKTKGETSEGINPSSSAIAGGGDNNHRRGSTAVQQQPTAGEELLSQLGLQKGASRKPGLPSYLSKDDSDDSDPDLMPSAGKNNTKTESDDDDFWN